MTWTGDTLIAALSEAVENENGIAFERAAYSRTREKTVVHLRAENPIAPSRVAALEERLLDSINREIALCVEVSISNTSLPKNVDAMLRNFTEVNYRPFLPCLEGAEIAVEGDALSITFCRQMSPMLFSGSGVLEAFYSYVKSSYGIKLRTGTLNCEMSEQQPTAREAAQDNPEEDKPAQNKLQTEQKPPWETIGSSEERIAPIVPAKKLPPPSKANRTKREKKGAKKEEAIREEGALFGKLFAAEPVPIRQAVPLTEEETRLYSENRVRKPMVVVEGEIIASEVRLTKENKFTIINFSITDFETSLRCKLFLRGDQSAEGSLLKAGRCVRVRGAYEWDSFLHDNVLTAKDILEAQKHVRVDNASEKRVELHLHTTMSAMDGFSSAKEYVAQAAAWGMKALAITDHGVVQAYPEAASAGKEKGVKILFGVEAYLLEDAKPVYDGAPRSFQDDYVVFDIETTGLSPKTCGITEIGAVRVHQGEIVEEFGTFVNPEMPIPPEITKLTGITDAMVQDAPKITEALAAFWAFAGDDCLVAHNASFDTGFIFSASDRAGFAHNNDVLDTLAVARVHLTNLKTHKLNILAEHYGISLKHHRAVNDARATAQILLKMFEECAMEGKKELSDLNHSGEVDYKNARSHHCVILCKNKSGLTNLYRLVSTAHLDYFHRRPRLPRHCIEEHREGLILGSACQQGELYQAILRGEPEEELLRIASFYDYLEIQPDANGEFLIRERMVKDKDALHAIARKILWLGETLGKPVVATGDAHYVNPEESVFRKIVAAGMGFHDADEETPLYFRTTEEMLGEFAWLGEETARCVVIENPNRIADSVEQIELFPLSENGQIETAMPIIPQAADYIQEKAWKKVKERYGDPVPEHIAARLERELESIIRNGFAVLYYLAEKLVTKSVSDGYLVGSRGSVGSSFAAWALDITEVCPLSPHYICEYCHHSDFDVDAARYGCGPDLPKKNCPVCGREYTRDGYDIPFEVFLGIDADKVPDIDLNFSGEYQPMAHKYTEELLGSEYVFRAGTISQVQEKTAFGYVKKYAEEHGMSFGKAEMDRLSKGISGTKRTTGQHPGGLVIVPKGREIYEFTPVQRPADKRDADTVTTHFDFNSMHDVLIKLDILGHDNPTAIHMLEELTGIDAMKIPLDDEKTLSLFYSTDALGLSPEQLLGCEVGTLGIPEFGTSFVRGMLCETRPKTIMELVRIAGLSHGTDVWLGNAADLIRSGQATLSEVICTRDDIMNGLVQKGVEKRQAFFIMESVRKGKWAKHKEKKQEEMEKSMRDANVDDWFIESCRKIAYMFPKAHAVAYVLMSLRIAYCKVYYPAAYYATFFSINAGDFDATYFLGGAGEVLRNLTALRDKGKDASPTEERTMKLLESAYEMNLRGIEFLPVDLKKSRARKFGVEGNTIRLPFLAIPKLGEKAADLLEQVMRDAQPMSVDELRRAAKLPTGVIGTMREMGCLEELSESSQISFFG